MTSTFRLIAALEAGVGTRGTTSASEPAAVDDGRHLDFSCEEATALFDVAVVAACGG